MLCSEDATPELSQTPLIKTNLQVIRSPSEHHPALFTEAVWTSRPAREKLAELLFEKYQAPAFFLVKNAVLCAFANGKSTALVVDAGASQTSAVPVIDG